MDRRSYRKVYRRLWTHEAFKAFTHDNKVVALYLLSGPQTNRIGIFRLSCAQLGEDLGVRRPRVSVERVCEAMDWRYDTKASVVWVPSWWSWNPPGDRPTNFRGMLTDLNDVPSTPLLAMFYQHTDDLPEPLHQYLSAWAQHEQSKGTARAQRERSNGSGEAETVAQVEHIRLPDGDVRTETERKDRTAPAAPTRFPQHPKSKEPNGDNYKPILKVAHEVLRAGDVPDEADLRQAVKARCHQLGIAMHHRDEGQADALVRACASAWNAHRIGA